MYSGSQCSQKRPAMNWWRRWNITARGLEANTRSVTHQSSLRCVSVDSLQCRPIGLQGGGAPSKAAKSQEMLYEDQKNFLSARGGKQRRPTFTLVVDLHLKWNQMPSVGHINNCSASTDSNCHTDL